MIVWGGTDAIVEIGACQPTLTAERLAADKDQNISHSLSAGLRSASFLQISRVGIAPIRAVASNLAQLGDASEVRVLTRNACRASSASQLRPERCSLRFSPHDSECFSVLNAHLNFEIFSTDNQFLIFPVTTPLDSEENPAETDLDRRRGWNHLPPYSLLQIFPSRNLGAMPKFDGVLLSYRSISSIRKPSSPGALNGFILQRPCDCFET